MDQLDLAADFEERFRAEAIKQHVHSFSDAEVIYCEDCDEEIHPRRRAALPHVTRCIECQQDEERR
ncbi:TraR/DksA C4-type zinc finger protein [Marinomonas transparens]|uniref:TraR/DksA C4-type zinc finger protein n=1 Tax=Marinomonas transparens TaxID=2795388 RepID=A0A934MVL6_9GAMM|nr:TraR/DksA C4-type zinc finger protein [Marinomonas transparens]MBJ7537174.1 TraR/DksA C4-type zinc finger protein [Marinomonas transparens]